METTIVQPGSSPSIYTTGDHGRHHGSDDRHRHDELRTDADYRSLISQGAVNGDRINTVGAATALASGHTDQLVQTAACHTDQLVLEGHARSREVVQAGFGGVHDRLCDAKAGIVDVVRNGTETAGREFCATNRNIDQARLETLGGFKDAQSLAFQNLGLIQLEAAKNAAALGVQATANANAASVEATKNFYALSLEAVKNASAAELRAQQIAAVAAAKAAECCCELKELIRAQTSLVLGQGSDFRMRDLEGRINRIPVGVAITIPPGL